MVRVSYGHDPLGRHPAIGIMTLSVDGYSVDFRVTKDDIGAGADAFEVRLFAPAMVALNRRVAQSYGVSDFPTISLKPGVSA